jgi:hypothetical protein
LREPATRQEFTREEVWLALRNHGMHLERLRYPITPIGMHYLLVHFDIPFVEPATYELSIGGLVRTPLVLSLNEIKARPAVTMPVAMECSGNGRPPVPAPDLGAVARGGGRVRRVDRHTLKAHPRGRRLAGRRGRDPLLRL